MKLTIIPTHSPNDPKSREKSQTYHDKSKYHEDDTYCVGNRPFRFIHVVGVIDVCHFDYFFVQIAGELLPVTLVALAWRGMHYRFFKPALKSSYSPR